MRTVVITGGSRGIGSAAVIAFAKAGYNVAFTYLNSEQRAKDLCNILETSYMIDCMAIKCDVSDHEAVNEAASAVIEKYGKVDVLVNNAGISLIKMITETTKEEWDRIMSVNLDSVFNTCSAFLPYMIREHRGCIINISSMWGETGASCEVAYSASKAGMIGFTKALAKEVGPSNIRVNCITPGVIMTDMNSSLDESTLKELQDETPLCKLGTPKNVADTIMFLASDKAAYITGQTIGVNGGIVI